MNKTTRPAPLPKPIKHRVWATLPNGKRVTCLTFKNHCYLVNSSHPNTKLGVQWYEEKAKAEKRTKFLNTRLYKMVSYPYPFVVVPVTREEES